MKSISIIIPVYNVSKYIDRCLNSLLNQGDNDFEIIVIDDGSTDSSFQKVLNYKEKFSNMKLFQKCNQGVSVARNFGITQASNDYLFFIDGDDWIEEDAIENLKLNLNTSTDVILFGYNSISSGKIKSKVFNKQKYLLKNQKAVRSQFQSIFSENSFYAPWNKVYKASFIKKNGISFPNGVAVGEDEIFNINVFKKVSSLRVINRSLYNYVVDRAGSASLNYDSRRLDSQISTHYVLDEMFSKWKGDFRSFLNRDNLTIALTHGTSTFETSKNLREFISNLGNKYFELIGQIDNGSFSRRDRELFFLCKHPVLLYVIFYLKNLIG